MMSDSELEIFLVSGSQLDRFFTAKEFFQWFDAIREDNQNKKYISKLESIGLSYEGRPMNGYYITEDTSVLGEEKSKKNVIYINALHHSREPLGLTMIMYLTIQMLRGIRNQNHNKVHEILRDNIIFVLPIVNIDSYTYINNHWNSSRRSDVVMIRKNRRPHTACDVYH